MSKLKNHLPNLTFVCLVVVSLLVGWFIPGFYEWTDSDQSRPSPLLWKVPLWSAIVSISICSALPWLPTARDESYENPRMPIRFSLRGLLMLTTGCAVAIPLLAKFPFVASGIVCAGAFAYFIAFWVRESQHRLAASALVACMILPYAWVVAYDELSRILPDLALMIAGMPAFVPTALIGSMLGQHFQESQWLAFLLTALELVIGIGIIRLGLKRTIVYLLFVIHMSALGSLVFYQLCVA